MKKLTFLILLSVLLSCNKDKQKAGKPGSPGGPPPIASYKVAPVYYGDAVITYNFPATIQGEQDVVIIPKVDGFIEKMYVDEGAIVKKGQLLFHLRNPQYEEAVRSANAQVKIAAANVKSAQMQVNQVKPLVDKNIVSNYALEANQYALESSQAALASAKANLTNAQVNLSYLTIRSPSNGTVGAIPYKTGSLVSSTSGNALTTVYNTANVYAYFSINEKQLLEFTRYFKGTTQKNKINSLEEVSLQLADGTIYPMKGKVTTSSGVVSTETGSANFRATFPNPNGLIQSGSSANILIPIGVDSTTLVPQEATFDLQGKKFVYQVVKKDSLLSTSIEVSENTIGNLFIVTKGLDKTATIVLEGVGGLKPGTRIKPIPVKKDSVYEAVEKAVSTNAIK
ncbi:efflux RND transporter periplasmic adaptor subunit [Kaistella flava (ex Peng et al. 2021)]|uniref:Efflux RND transporter periplasmic adaptor subunit n=1 Tax=Kaistella flava (ex Peng et al. 2021) TaxID=2038776 RepID=A0A7M2YCS5_9FLAO|nr:efflux RND transporter periplasmic adaptor subunit [Kaistella flava (ex Peng et al. 2021)]QOW11850.1 efflux RND transporter periplasmic adaptor subunit [Kaistella flava (ex Peng et al. 2021)]